jgi:siroheme synthase
MPGPDYGRTARELTACGVDANTPCVLVSNAGRSSEKLCFMALADLPFVAGVSAPAILIVGEVARRSPDVASEISDLTSQIYPPAIEGTRVTSSPSLKL